MSLPLFLFAAVACPAPTKLPLEIKKVIPRNHPSFTEGLIFRGGQLFESVGLFGNSGIQRIDPNSGESEKIAALPNDQFGEGIVEWHGELLQLTWRQGLVWHWPLTKSGVFTLAALVKTTPYPREGWGISSSEKTGLVASDGSDQLFFLNPVTFQAERTVHVRDGRGPVTGLNELEVVESSTRSSIWANVWLSYRLVRIDPITGCVTGELDLTALKAELNPAARAALAQDPDAVPNGIAYDPEHSVLYLTAKKWPIFFKIALP